jgi:hypothetical protein
MIDEMPPQITRREIYRDSASLDGCRDLAPRSRSISKLLFSSLSFCMLSNVVCFA